ncbi:hypothetical protein N9D55_06860 [Flavobacteriaceae bacterium]|nr:hypothetical protein [Flavobacteriaceae bacterium]
MKKITLFFILILSITCYGQKLGDSKFMVKMKEENKFIGDGGSINYDFYDSTFIYEVVPEGHYIYYNFLNDKCTGIEEKIIGTNLKQTYKLYKNILDSNDFGIKISEGENYTCFIKNGSKLQVIIREGYSNDWYVAIYKGFRATWGTKGC